MEPSKRPATRNSRRENRENQSPLQELAATRQRTRAARTNAAAQKQQSHSTSSAPPTRNTRSTRSTSPNLTTATNDEDDTKSMPPKVEPKKRGRPTKKAIPSTAQSVGLPTTRISKRNHNQPEDAEDADAESSSSRSPKHQKTVHLEVIDNPTYLQLNPSTKREFEPSTHQGAGDESPPKRQRRVSPSKIPSPTIPGTGARRASKSQKSPFAYAPATLSNSPSALNPFALVPEHEPFGSTTPLVSPPKHLLFEQDDSQDQVEQEQVDEEEEPEQELPQAPSFTPIALPGVPSGVTPAVALLALNSTPELGPTGVTPGVANLDISTFIHRKDEEDSPASTDYEASPYIGSPELPETSYAEPYTPTHKPRSRSSSNGSQKQPNRTSASVPPQQIVLTEAHFERPLSQVPYALPVQERLPPKPSSTIRRALPASSRPPTPYVNHSSRTYTDLDDSLELSDDDDETIDMAEAKRKNREWKTNYHNYKAIEAEAKAMTEMARSKLMQGQEMSPVLKKQPAVTRDVRRKQDHQESSASRNSMTLSTIQSVPVLSATGPSTSHPILLFPAIGTDSEITITNTKLIGFLRAIHDEVISSDTLQTLPDPKEVVALLSNQSRQSSEIISSNSGQKAGIEQHSNGGQQTEHITQSGDDGQSTLTPGSRTPSTPGAQHGGWFSTIKKALTPFVFKGTTQADNRAETTHANASEKTPSRTTDVTRSPHANASEKTLSRTTDVTRSPHAVASEETPFTPEVVHSPEFNFAVEHNVDTQTTPSRPPRMPRAQSERRPRTQPASNNARSISRIPNTRIINSARINGRAANVGSTRRAEIAERKRRAEENSYIGTMAQQQHKRQRVTAVGDKHPTGQDTGTGQASDMAGNTDTIQAGDTITVGGTTTGEQIMEDAEEEIKRLTGVDNNGAGYGEDQAVKEVEVQQEDEQAVMSAEERMAMQIKEWEIEKTNIKVMEKERDDRIARGEEQEGEFKYHHGRRVPTGFFCGPSDWELYEDELEVAAEKAAEAAAEAAALALAEREKAPPVHERFLPKKASGLRNVMTMSPMLEGERERTWEEIQADVEAALGPYMQAQFAPALSESSFSPMYVQQAVFAHF